MGDRRPRILDVPTNLQYWSQYGGEPPSDWRSAPGTITISRIVRHYKSIIVSDDSSYRGPKYCWHTTVNHSVPTIPLRGYYQNLGRWFIADYGTPFDPEPYFIPLIIQHWNPYGVDWDRIVAPTLPQLRSEFNLINFAWEAGELRDLFGSLRRILTRPTELARRAGFVRTPRGWRYSLREQSDSFLEYSFGVSPLASDLETIAERVANFGEDIGRANARLRRGYKAKAQNPISGSASYDVQFSDYFGNLYYGTLSISYTGVESVGCRIAGHIPYDPVRAYLDYIGLYPDLSTLWNALPFSFLIDYLAPVGQALEPGPWMRPSYSVTDGCYSIKVDFNWSISISQDCWANWYPHFRKEPWGPPLDQHVITQGTATVYMREPVPAVLDGIDLPNLFAPRLGQQARAAALAISNTPRSSAPAPYLRRLR